MILTNDLAIEASVASAAKKSSRLSTPLCQPAWNRFPTLD